MFCKSQLQRECSNPNQLHARLAHLMHLLSHAKYLYIRHIYIYHMLFYFLLLYTWLILLILLADISENPGSFDIESSSDCDISNDSLELFIFENIFSVVHYNIQSS